MLAQRRAFISCALAADSVIQDLAKLQDADMSFTLSANKLPWYFLYPDRDDKAGERPDALLAPLNLTPAATISGCCTNLRTSRLDASIASSAGDLGEWLIEQNICTNSIDYLTGGCMAQ